MAVITADGVVGKVLRTFGSTSQVLLINDQSSGVGGVLDKSRLQGVVKGTSSGDVILENVMTDESVAPGERVATSGGDQIFPKGLTVGTVMKVSPGADLFLNIRLKPSASLNRLEEVLVITKKEDRAPAVADSGSRVRAVDILTQRLPSVPDKPSLQKHSGRGPDREYRGIAVKGAASPKSKGMESSGTRPSRDAKPESRGKKARSRCQAEAGACRTGEDEPATSQSVADKTRHVGGPTSLGAYHLHIAGSGRGLPV